MIKLYKKVFIKNSKVEYDYKYEFEAYLPKVLTTSYKKVYRGIWTSKVKVIWSKQTAHVLNNLENYLFQIYDTSGEYIGAYIPNTTDTERVGKADVMTINCNHVLITLLDSIISEPLVFDSTDINKVITRLFSYQKIRLWKYVGMEHAEEAVDIDIKPQSGILSPLLEVATQLSPNYYFKYETEKFPFTLKLARATDRPAARIREGWNLMKPKYTEDPSNIYNRLYVYGEKPIITGIRKTDNPDKSFDEQLKKDTAAWKQYQRDYQAWKTKQIKMQKDRDAALEARKKLVASGKGSSGLPALPPRPSTVPPPDKPSLSSRTMGTQQVTIAPKNPTKKEYIEDVDSIKRYGLKERYLEFKDIADSELLYTIGKRIFERRDGYIYDYTIKAADLNKILEKPIPFDWIRLGTTVSLQTYRYGKEIDNELIITEESKEDIESHPENIELRVQLKSSASAPTVSHSPIGNLLSKIEEKEYDIIKAYESANGKNTIYAGKDAPPNPKVNDIWYRQTLDDVGKPKIEMLIFNGAIWVNPFAELDNIDETIARNEKELDALMEEAELSMSNLEKNVQKNAEDINKKVKELDDQIASKITEIEKSLKDSAAKVDQAVKDATDLLQGNLNTLEKQMQERVDKQISEAQTELLAKAKELVNGVEVKVDEKIGLLKKTIAQTTETTDGLKQKVTQFEESINGLSARMVETEKTANSAKTTVGEIQNSVNHLSSTFQTLQETSDSLTKRLSSVEQDATGLRTLIESTEKNLGGKISNLNTRVQTAEGNYSTLRKKVNDVNEKTNKVVSTVDKNTATIAQQTKDISATSEKVSSLSTTVTQTNDKVATIITNYAKKSDLKDLATKEFATTQIEAKAGELSAVISKQKEEIDNSIAGIKARPTYTIGKDGYWYKDGKKTDTLAKGQDGADGGEFGWNLLLEGDLPNTNSDKYMIRRYTFDEEIPELAPVSLVTRVKGKRGDSETNHIMPYNTGGSVNAFLKNLDLPDDSDTEFRTYVLKGYWHIMGVANKELHFYWGNYGMEKYDTVSIEWTKLVYGHNPTMEFAPAKSEIYGKDAHLYTGTTPPKDTKMMWFNPKDMTTYVYINDKWVDMNKETKDQVVAHTKTINDLKVTDTQIKSDISQIKASNTQTTTKINTLNRTLDQMESAIMASNDGFVGLQDQVNRNVTQILQTKDRVNTIISDYAKKKDLNGFVTENKVNTIVEAKAGSIKTSLSSEITTLDKKVNGLQSRPVYTIGSDGYWYKDGKKTDTKALGDDGNNFKWNLIDGGDQTASSNKIVDNRYVFNQDIPEGTEMSIGVSYKGVDRYMLFQLIINDSYTNSTQALQLKNNSDTTSIYTTTIKMPKSVQKGDRIRIFFNTPREKDTWKYIYWFSLVMGNQPVKEFVPSKNDIQGKDGKDAKVYKSSTAPSDTSQLWYNTNDGEVYVYYNGDWKNINATVQTQIHTVEDTVSSHTRTISSLDRGMSAMGEGLTDNKFQITEVKAQLEGFKSTVKNQDYLSIINQQAHQQIFEVKSGSYSSKLRITPETVYISSATIKSSHIASLSANKLTAGTIDAKQIRVINIDASNITTGKISGYRGYWNLNSGEIYNGYSDSNITIQNGIFQYGTYNGVGVIVDGNGININYRTTANGTYQHVGNLQASKWINTTGFAANFRLGHKKGTSMTLSYYNESESVYNPYITFDKYRAYGGKKKRPGHTDRDIIVNQDIGFDSDLYFDAYTKFMFYNGMRMQTCYITMTNGYKYSGIFIGNGWDSSHGLNSGLYICTAGLYFADGSATREIFTAGYHIKNVSYYSPPKN